METQMGDAGDVSTFLGYRYLPDQPIIDEYLQSAANHDTPTGTFDSLADSGVTALLETVREIADESPADARHVIPLSGGLDSRILLGAVTSVIPTDELVALTYGTLGSYDWELGQQVAEAAGIEHHHIDLRPRKFDWSRDFQLRMIDYYSHPTKLFGGLEALMVAYDHHGITESDVCWTGYMGDAISGDHLPKTESKTWDEAIAHFITKNFKAGHLTAPGYDPTERLPDNPIFDREALNYDDQLDIGIRQPYLIAPSKLFGDYHVAPFHRDPFFSFMINAPREVRTDRSLYREIGQRIAPELFKVPTQQSRGLGVGVSKTRVRAHIVRQKAEQRVRKAVGRPKPPKHTRRFDWDLELRRSESLQSTIEPLLTSLAERDIIPWLSPTELYQSHQRGEDNGYDIYLLSSLELHLQHAE